MPLYMDEVDTLLQDNNSPEILWSFEEYISKSLLFGDF